MIAHLLKPEFEELIDQKDWVSLKEALSDVPSVDLAELLEGIDPSTAVVVFRLIKKTQASEVFAYLPSSHGQELLEVFSKRQMADVMSNLEPDDRVALLEELPGHLTQRVLNSMSSEDQVEVKKLLGYPEESVGRLMTTNYVRIKKEWTVERSLEHIRQYGYSAETVNVLYVVDEYERLIDDLRINQFILSNPTQVIEELMDDQFTALSAFDDQEEAVRMFSKYDRIALPVVDSDGILVGIVTVDDIIDVAEEETTEDMQLMAGMNALERVYSETSIVMMVRKRIGWLLILFLGQMLTVTAMAAYNSLLAAAAMLAVFIPMIISSGGNSGSQAATLIIRALSTDDISLIDWRHVFKRELLSGAILGFMVGLMGFGITYAWIEFQPGEATLSIMQALTVGCSLFGVILFGNLSGSMLPFIMSKIGLDPAVTSAPFVATLVDVTGIIIYFSIAMFLLRGLLS
ncbi:MAG: magnesium transporter [Balneolaceae bacterium]|nr:magnesium transporter [Balneolaceae bacterium]MDR9446237.1 magnesium transporter [Balneolaceae bacterium]